MGNNSTATEALQSRASQLEGRHATTNQITATEALQSRASQLEGRHATTNQITATEALQSKASLLSQAIQKYKIDTAEAIAGATSSILSEISVASKRKPKLSEYYVPVEAHFGTLDPNKTYFSSEEKERPWSLERELDGLVEYIKNHVRNYNDYVTRNNLYVGDGLHSNTKISEDGKLPDLMEYLPDERKLVNPGALFSYLFAPDSEAQEEKEAIATNIRREAPNITKIATFPANFAYGAAKATGIAEGLAFLTDYPEATQKKIDSGYQKMITGSSDGEYTTADKIGQGIGALVGSYYSYKGANDLLGNVGAFQQIKNPIVRNLVTGQVADTIVQTPRVIFEGISGGKSAREIVSDVVKQQGEDLLWNLGSEAVGQIFQGGKNLLSNSRDIKAKIAAINKGLTDTSDVAKNLMHSTEGLSDDTITAIRKIQTIADTAGKDFSEVASAVVQKKTMKELRPEVENFVSWMKTNDSVGYIKRVDFDNVGKIRIDRGAKGTFSMDLDDLKGVRSITDKKSVFYFDDSELEATKKWAEKFWNDLGNKSPYYRAANGDWRATSKELVDITEVKYQPDYDIKKVPRGTFQNQDTGWEIAVGRKGIDDTISHSGNKKYSISSLDKIDELIERSVLIDTEVSIKNAENKSLGTAFMHKLYAPVRIDGKLQVAKITVEESVQIGTKDTYRKFYNLRNIEISSENSGNFILKDYATVHISDDTTISITDLYEIVKQSDKDFYLNTGKLAKQSDEIRKIVAEIPSGKNSFISGELAKLSDSEIEAVIKEENLPFRDAKDVRNSAKIVDDITSGKTGHSVLSLDTPETKARRELLFYKIFGFSKEKFEDSMVDRYSVVKIFDKLDSSTNTDVRLEMYIKSGSQSEYLKKIKFTDMEGNEIGKSLDEIFGGIKKRHRRAFDEYLFHKYNFERWENGVPLEVDIPQGESLKIFSRLEELHPEFKTVSEELYAFNNSLNFEWGVKSGIISETWFDNATKVYPSYVPTYREFGGAVDSVTSAEKTGHNVSKIFRKAEVRHEKVYDVKKLFENKIDIMVNAARKQQLQEDMIRKVLNNPSKFTHVGKILDISKESINVRGEALADGADLSSYLKKLYDSNIDDTFTMSAYLDGKLYTIGISERLHNAFSYVTAGGSQTLKVGAQKTIDFWGKHVTGNFKKVVTSLNPLYGASNVARDLPNALISTKGTMWDMTKAYPEAMAKILKKDDTWKQFCALGGSDSAMMENVGKSLTQKSYNPIKFIEKINGFTEAVPRYSEFLISLRNGDDVYTALKNSADVTVNFARGGRLSKNIDKLLVPYFNARMQGFYHSTRLMKKAPLKTINRAAIAFTIPTVVLYAMNKDNPHYEDLRERQKNYYFNIPMMDSLDANGYPTKFLKLPKTDQFGFVFGTMMEKSLRAASGDEETFDNFWQELSDGFMPFNTRNFTENFYSAGWRSIVDNMILGKTDIVDFAGRPVIPEELRELPASQQYDETTSGLSIWIAQKIGVSPKVLDYLIQSYTGIIGETVLPFSQPNVENPWMQPINKRFVVDSLYSNDIVSNWHNLYTGAKFMRNEAEEDWNYPEYYKYRSYARDMGEAYEQANQIKFLIDNLIANGASKDSEAVRNLRNQYLNCYKKVIQKYEDVGLPTVDGSVVKNGKDVIGMTDKWHELYSEMAKQRDAAEQEWDYSEYYRFREYAKDLWTAHEKAKQINEKVDALVASGVPVDSDEVRSLLEQYEDCYKNVISKYEDIKLEEVDDSTINNTSDVFGLTDKWYELYSEMKEKRNAARQSGNYGKYYQYKEYTNDLWTAHENAKKINEKVDALVASGVSVDSDEVRSLLEQSENCYKNVISKYDGNELPKSNDSAFGNTSNVIGKRYKPYSKSKQKRNFAKQSGNYNKYQQHKEYTNDLRTINEITKQIEDLVVGGVSKDFETELPFAQRNVSEQELDYSEYYKYRAYTNDLLEAREQAKQIKALIASLIANGVSINSETVRNLMEQYVNCYKKVISNYQNNVKGE